MKMISTDEKNLKTLCAMIYELRMKFSDEIRRSVLEDREIKNIYKLKDELQNELKKFNLTISDVLEILLSNIEEGNLEYVEEVSFLLNFE